ncbi:hypothetical protein [Pseudomonas fluorescens]|uniref:hypothetical protein n=1 Tax=Pseudomonas fluorescens TaxID=294 RepID=UPI001CD7F95F|nr:hypothetical protein [Pseudomonas fluorescens]
MRLALGNLLLISLDSVAAQSWLPDQPGDYLWSIPLFIQPDVLITRHAPPCATTRKCRCSAFCAPWFG